ncbi:MAG: DNA-3-methyladenine glycosylase 2 family protein [Acidimicrobiia bacterium]|nr:DNA-3-methyladenine glycosylase 2 family protein [Acidimicrobiia bacterium]
MGLTSELELRGTAPLDTAALFAFLGARAVPGVEVWDGAVFHRSLDLVHGPGVARLRPAGVNRAAVTAHIRLADERDLDDAVGRLRRLLDLDVDIAAVDGALAADPVLAPVVAAAPGMRKPGSVDPFETAVRAVIGQQISVAGARTVAGRIVALIGAPLELDGGPVAHRFPTPAALAAIDPELLPMPWSRRRTLLEMAARVADGRVVLDHDAPAADVTAALLDVPGIGPWTAGYVQMRGLGDPDVFLPTDLGVVKSLAVLGVEAERAARWAPWRSYALHHLWRLSGFAVAPRMGGKGPA